MDRSPASVCAPNLLFVLYYVYHKHVVWHGFRTRDILQCNVVCCIELSHPVPRSQPLVSGSLPQCCLSGKIGIQSPALHLHVCQRAAKL